MQQAREKHGHATPSLAQQFFCPPFYPQGLLANVPSQTTLPTRRVASGSPDAPHASTQKKTRHPRYLLASNLTQHQYMRPSRYLLASSLTQYSSFLMGAYINSPPPPFPLPQKFQRPKFSVALDTIQEEEAHDDLDSPLSSPS